MSFDARETGQLGMYPKAYVVGNNSPSAREIAAPVMDIARSQRRYESAMLSLFNTFLSSQDAGQDLEVFGGASLSVVDDTSSLGMMS